MDDLGEIRIGEWTGLSLEELEGRDDWKRFNHYRSGVRPPGGELMAETQTRMVTALYQLRERHPNDTVAVVSHGDPLRAALLYYLGMPLDFIFRFTIDPASLTVVEAGEWGARVMCMNTGGDALS